MHRHTILLTIKKRKQNRVGNRLVEVSAQIFSNYSVG